MITTTNRGEANLGRDLMKESAQIEIDPRRTFKKQGKELFQEEFKDPTACRR